MKKSTTDISSMKDYKSFEQKAETLCDQAKQAKNIERILELYVQALKNRLKEIHCRELSILNTSLSTHYELTEAYAGALDILEILIKKAHDVDANLLIFENIIAKQKNLLQTLLKKSSQLSALHRSEFELINSEFLYYKTKMQNANKDSANDFFHKLESTYQELRKKFDTPQLNNWEEAETLLKTARKDLERLTPPKPNKNSMVTKSKKRKSTTPEVKTPKLPKIKKSSLSNHPLHIRNDFIEFNLPHFASHKMMEFVLLATFNNFSREQALSALKATIQMLAYQHFSNSSSTQKFSVPSSQIPEGKLFGFIQNKNSEEKNRYRRVVTDFIKKMSLSNEFDRERLPADDTLFSSLGYDPGSHPFFLLTFKEKKQIYENLVTQLCSPSRIKISSPTPTFFSSEISSFNPPLNSKNNLSGFDF